MSAPNAITGAQHYVGRYVDYKPGWRVFTDWTLADGGAVCVGDAGPFASQTAAAICADMANAEKVEEIGNDLLRRARAAYLNRILG